MCPILLMNTKYQHFADTVGPADVGLEEQSSDDDRGLGFSGLYGLNRVARWAQPITYLDIYECDSFTVCSIVTKSSEINSFRLLVLDSPFIIISNA